MTNQECHSIQYIEDYTKKMANQECHSISDKGKCHHGMSGIQEIILSLHRIVRPQLPHFKTQVYTWKKSGSPGQSLEENSEGSKT